MKIDSAVARCGGNLPAIGGDALLRADKHLIATDDQVCPGLLVADLAFVERLEFLRVGLEEIHRAALIEDQDAIPVHHHAPVLPKAPVRSPAFLTRLEVEAG